MRMPNKFDARVLVVPSDHLDRLGRFQGFCADADRYLLALLRPEVAGFRKRGLVEDDPRYKQVIPYVIFRCGDSVFSYTRGTSQGERRLHRLRSLGVGGHVEEADLGGRGTLEAYEAALRREVDEEVVVNSPGVIRRAGLINDDSNPVGAVHLGVVHLYQLERAEVEPRERGLLEAGFSRVDQLPAISDQFETWSRFCIESLLTR